MRQYFHKGLLWRAPESEEVASYELFVDLLYVGIIAINGDMAIEHPTGEVLLRFCISFILGWKIWTDYTLVVSWFESGTSLVFFGAIGQPGQSLFFILAIALRRRGVAL